MPLPSNQPWLLAPTGGAEFGSPVGRLLNSFMDPNRYTRQLGATLPSGNVVWQIVGGSAAPATAANQPVPVMTPGGRTALDMSLNQSTLILSGRNFPGAITVDGWLCPSNLSTNTLFYESDVSRGALQRIAIAGGATGGQSIRITVLGSTSFTYDLSINGTVPSNTWTHVAVVVQPGGLGPYGFAYLNGRLYGSNTTRDATRGASSTLHLLTAGTQLGEWKFYTRALDASEILQNYNALAPTYGRPVIPV